MSKQRLTNQQKFEALMTDLANEPDGVELISTFHLLSEQVKIDIVEAGLRPAIMSLRGIKKQREQVREDLKAAAGLTFKAVEAIWNGFKTETRKLSPHVQAAAQAVGQGAKAVGNGAYKSFKKREKEMRVKNDEYERKSPIRRFFSLPF